MEAVAAVNPIMPPNKTLSSVSSKSPEEVENEYKQELKELAEDSGHGDSEEEIDAYVEKNRDLPFVLESMSFPGKTLIDLKHVNGNVIIRLNTRHKFYKQVWAELKNIADKSEGEVSGLMLFKLRSKPLMV